MNNHTIYRSSEIKDVIKIKVKKYAGYFNPETKSFSVDPHLTSYSDLQQILIQAFSLRNSFQITYLCRDDIGEKLFLPMLTDWDLDAAFLTSSEPHLKLKLDAEPHQKGLISKITETELDNPDEFSDISENKGFTNIFQSKNKRGVWDIQTIHKSWTDKLGGAFNKLTIWGNQQLFQGDTCIFPHKPPLDDEEFRSYLDQEGRLIRCEELRLRIYHGGIDPSLRKVVWRILLNVFPSDLTGEERLSYIKQKSDEYCKLRTKWQSKADDFCVKQASSMIWKDVIRTDRTHRYYDGADDNPHSISLLNILTTYALTHPRTAYCQGMSDIASLISVVMDNEAQTYICFCAIMERLHHNFSLDGVALSTKFQHLAMLVECFDPQLFAYFKSLGADNMFFCYRWLVLEMKREFSFDDAIIMSEVMWSSLPPQPPTHDLHLEDVSVDSEVSKQPTDLSRHKIKEKKDKQKEGCRSSEPGSFEFLRNDFTSLLKDIQPSESKFEDSLSEEDEDGITYRMKSPLLNPDPKLLSIQDLPSPQDLGYGHPFLLFVALALLIEERSALLKDDRASCGYEELAMHFSKAARSHSPRKILSKAMKYFCEYLKTNNNESR